MGCVPLESARRDGCGGWVESEMVDRTDGQRIVVRYRARRRVADGDGPRASRADALCVSRERDLVGAVTARVERYDGPCFAPGEARGIWRSAGDAQREVCGDASAAVVVDNMLDDGDLGGLIVVGDGARPGLPRGDRAGAIR